MRHARDVNAGCDGRINSQPRHHLIHEFGLAQYMVEHRPTETKVGHVASRRDIPVAFLKYEGRTTPAPVAERRF